MLKLILVFIFFACNLNSFHCYMHEVPIDVNKKKSQYYSKNTKGIHDYNVSIRKNINGFFQEFKFKHCVIVSFIFIFCTILKTQLNFINIHDNGIKNDSIINKLNNTREKIKHDIFMYWDEIDINKTNLKYCDFIYDSLLYVPNCSWSNNIAYKWPLLITSTPRSGTVYMKTILDFIGVKIENDWCSPVKNRSNGQVSWIDAFYEKNEENHIGPSRIGNSRFITVLHQVREPLASISSICTEPVQKEKNLKNYNFINSHTDQSLKNIGKNATQVELIMQFFYSWHMKLNLFNFPIFKVENLFDRDNITAIETLNWITKISNLTYKITENSLFSKNMSNKLYNRLHSKQNSRNHRKKFTWDELFLINEPLAKNIFHLAKKYGYKYDWNYDIFNKTTKQNHT